jgi:hypothetical protein
MISAGDPAKGVALGERRTIALLVSCAIEPGDFIDGRPAAGCG